MKLSHIIYKVDDLNEAVRRFTALGFHVEYGQKKNPHNALIYFNDRTYIELIEKMYVTKLVAFLLKIFGMREYLDSTLRQNEREEGFVRFASHMTLEDKKKLKERYKKKLNCDTFFVPVSRKDIHDNKLSCKCVMPSNADYPFFVTPFLEAHSIWNNMHSNQVKGIKKVVYSATDKELDFFKELSMDTRLELVRGGRGITKVEFKTENSGDATVIFDGEWKTT